MVSKKSLFIIAGICTTVIILGGVFIWDSSRRKKEKIAKEKAKQSGDSILTDILNNSTQEGIKNPQQFAKNMSYIFDTSSGKPIFPNMPPPSQNNQQQMDAVEVLYQAIVKEMEIIFEKACKSDPQASQIFTQPNHPDRNISKPFTEQGIRQVLNDFLAARTFTHPFINNISLTILQLSKSQQTLTFLNASLNQKNVSARRLFVSVLNIFLTCGKYNILGALFDELGAINLQQFCIQFFSENAATLATLFLLDEQELTNLILQFIEIDTLLNYIGFKGDCQDINKVKLYEGVDLLILNQSDLNLPDQGVSNINGIVSVKNPPKLLNLVSPVSQIFDPQNRAEKLSLLSYKYVLIGVNILHGSNDGYHMKNNTIKEGYLPVNRKNPFAGDFECLRNNKIVKIPFQDVLDELRAHEDEEILLIYELE